MPTRKGREILVAAAREFHRSRKYVWGMPEESQSQRWIENGDKEAPLWESPRYRGGAPRLYEFMSGEAFNQGENQKAVADASAPEDTALWKHTRTGKALVEAGEKWKDVGTKFKGGKWWEGMTAAMGEGLREGGELGKAAAGMVLPSDGGLIKYGMKKLGVERWGPDEDEDVSEAVLRKGQEGLMKVMEAGTEGAMGAAGAFGGGDLDDGFLKRMAKGGAEGLKAGWRGDIEGGPIRRTMNPQGEAGSQAEKMGEDLVRFFGNPANLPVLEGFAAAGHLSPRMMKMLNKVKVEGRGGPASLTEAQRFAKRGAELAENRAGGPFRERELRPGKSRTVQGPPEQSLFGKVADAPDRWMEGLDRGLDRAADAGGRMVDRVAGLPGEAKRGLKRAGVAMERERRGPKGQRREGLRGKQASVGEFEDMPDFLGEHGRWEHPAPSEGPFVEGGDVASPREIARAGNRFGEMPPSMRQSAEPLAPSKRGIKQRGPGFFVEDPREAGMRARKFQDALPFDEAGKWEERPRSMDEWVGDPDQTGSIPDSTRGGTQELGREAHPHEQLASEVKEVRGRRGAPKRRKGLLSRAEKAEIAERVDRAGEDFSRKGGAGPEAEGDLGKVDATTKAKGRSGMVEPGPGIQKAVLSRDRVYGGDRGRSVINLPERTPVPGEEPIGFQKRETRAGSGELPGNRPGFIGPTQDEFAGKYGRVPELKPGDPRTIEDWGIVAAQKTAIRIRQQAEFYKNQIREAEGAAKQRRNNTPEKQEYLRKAIEHAEGQIEKLRGEWSRTTGAGRDPVKGVLPAGAPGRKQLAEAIELNAEATQKLNLMRKRWSEAKTPAEKAHWAEESEEARRWAGIRGDQLRNVKKGLSPEAQEAMESKQVSQRSSERPRGIEEDMNGVIERDRTNMPGMERPGGYEEGGISRPTTGAEAQQPGFVMPKGKRPLPKNTAASRHAGRLKTIQADYELWKETPEWQMRHEAETGPGLDGIPEREGLVKQLAQLVARGKLDVAQVASHVVEMAEGMSPNRAMGLYHRFFEQLRGPENNALRKQLSDRMAKQLRQMGYEAEKKKAWDVGGFLREEAGSGKGNLDEFEMRDQGMREEPYVPPKSKGDRYPTGPTREE